MNLKHDLDGNYLALYRRLSLSDSMSDHTGGVMSRAF